MVDQPSQPAPSILRYLGKSGGVNVAVVTSLNEWVYSTADDNDLELSVRQVMS